MPFYAIIISTYILHLEKGCVKYGTKIMIIGIIGAMNIETDLMISKLDSPKKVTYAQRDFYTGILNDKNVVIVTSGISMINAAITTQILIDRFNPDYIINTGIAGSVDNNVRVKDVVISTDAVQYQVDVSKYGYKIGQIPSKNTYSFKASDKLIDIIKNLKFDIDSNIHYGRIVSGDKFISNNSDRTYLSEYFNALCTEMEGAAIAHVCYDNEIPFCIIRSISDNADGNADISYEQFEKISADISSRFITDILSHI